MDWQNIAVWVTVAAVAGLAVRGIVRRLRGRSRRSCCGCGERDCPNRAENRESQS